MFIWKEWLSVLLQFFILIPSAISCYLPAKNQMRFSFSKTVILCLALILPIAFIGAYIVTVFEIEINILLMPMLLVFFFLYRKTVHMSLPKELAIYVGVCAIQTFPSQFANYIDIYLKSDAQGLTLPAALIHLCLSNLLMVAFIYPARNLFFRMVDGIHIVGIWYSTIGISLIFLVSNLLAVPSSYELIRNSRLRYVFPVMECCGLVLLILIYVLFYRSAIVLIERAELEKRSQLLEMQAHQFRKLQEYMYQTRRLRHDFKHSIHLLSSLAEHEDIEGIRIHLSEYEKSLTVSTLENFCKNSSLNALFSYYHEMAKEAGVKIDWKIELPEPLSVSELDMAALFGNLMENAIMACATLPEGQRYFGLTSKIHQGNSLYVVSTNSFDGKVRKEGDSYYSTKHSGRGTGLASIAAVAKKYQGMAKISNSEKEFFVDVVLKI